MKPRIYKDKKWNNYYCELPEEAEPDPSDEKAHYIWTCCGVGKTMKGAYENWLEDIERYEE